MRRERPDSALTAFPGLRSSGQINRPLPEAAGKLHAIKEKIGNPHAQVANGVALPTRPLFANTIADLLNDVKSGVDDTSKRTSEILYLYGNKKEPTVG